VQVLEGKEFLNKPDPLEASMLKKWGVVNWRLSCRCVVGPDNAPGAIKFKVTPQRPFNKK
jgi:ferredoxin